ncbi:hypothetical protein E2C01_037699 [Portunus trituberculatus]|uniref:Uncharacterized protein n=1 Tax=Portunus trituberculatus TaxID=210409 RepID=A0A5B7F8T6_PORTR|nr:hypothetical protein [Portunus trituberculatus]
MTLVTALVKLQEASQLAQLHVAVPDTSLHPQLSPSQHRRQTRDTLVKYEEPSCDLQYHAIGDRDKTCG